jgi:hypothetical protein
LKQKLFEIGTRSLLRWNITTIGIRHWKIKVFGILVFNILLVNSFFASWAFYSTLIAMSRQKMSFKTNGIILADKWLQRVCN